MLAVLPRPPFVRQDKNSPRVPRPPALGAGRTGARAGAPAAAGAGCGGGGGGGGGGAGWTWPLSRLRRRGAAAAGPPTRPVVTAVGGNIRNTHSNAKESRYVGCVASRVGVTVLRTGYTRHRRPVGFPSPSSRVSCKLTWKAACTCCRPRCAPTHTRARRTRKQRTHSHLQREERT